MKKVFILFALAAFILPLSTAAFECPGVTDANGACVLRSDLLTKGVSDVLTIVDTITNWLFTILLTLAVLFVIIAAYKYLMSGGGEEVGQAHKMLLYAAVAVAVAILARGVVNVVKVITSASSSDTSAGPVTTPPATSDSATSNPPSGAPATSLPAGHTGNFFEVSGVVVNGSAVKIEVEYCSDGKKPGVMINGQKYGDNPTIVSATTPSVGKYLFPAIGSPSVQKCIDGIIPNIKVNGALNGSVTAKTSTQPVTTKTKPNFKLAGPCNVDGKTVSVKIDGVIYPGTSSRTSGFFAPYVRQSDFLNDNRVYALTCSDGVFISYIDLDGVRYVVSPSAALPMGQ